MPISCAISGPRHWALDCDREHLIPDPKPPVPPRVDGAHAQTDGASRAYAARQGLYLGWMESPASRRFFAGVPIGWQSGAAMPGTFTRRFAVGAGMGEAMAHGLAARPVPASLAAKGTHEDFRRMSNGEQVNRVAGLAMASKRSVDFTGYWQRHIKSA
jgi:hypothetical protein